MADKPYSRVYHSIVDDPKFADVFDNDRRLATWLRLLIVAEQSYPASAYLPIGTHMPTVRALATAGLIDLGTGSRYRVHGLASEREMRSQSARNAAALRWHSPRNADPMLVRDETRRDEYETSSPLPLKEGKRANGTNPRALGTNPRANGTSPRQERQAAKRAPTRLHEILTAIQKGDVE